MAEDKAVPTPEAAVRALPEEDLAVCLEEDGFIALVTGETAELMLAGTRSEAVRIRVRMEAALHGRAPESFELCRYTSAGDTKVEPGGLYVAVAVPNPKYGEAFELLAQCKVSEPVSKELVARLRQVVADVLEQTKRQQQD